MSNFLNHNAVCGFGHNHNVAPCPYQYIHDGIEKREAQIKDQVETINSLSSKLERASKFANANAEDVESLQGKVRELEGLCSSQALRLSSASEEIEALRSELGCYWEERNTKLVPCKRLLECQSRLGESERQVEFWKGRAHEEQEDGRRVSARLFDAQNRLDAAHSKIRGLFVSLRQSEGMSLQEAWDAWDKHGQRNLIGDVEKLTIRVTDDELAELNRNAVARGEAPLTPVVEKLNPIGEPK